MQIFSSAVNVVLVCLGIALIAMHVRSGANVADLRLGTLLKSPFVIGILMLEFGVISFFGRPSTKTFTIELAVASIVFMICAFAFAIWFEARRERRE